MSVCLFDVFSLIDDVVSSS